jgi:hypothetical protein
MSKTQTPQKQPSIATAPNPLGEALDNFLRGGADLFDDAAASVARRIGEEGRNSDIAAAADRRLRDIAAYLRRRDGNQLVSSAIEKARTYPAVFIAGTAAVAAAVAIAIVSGGTRSPMPDRHSTAEGGAGDSV